MPDRWIDLTMPVSPEMPTWPDNPDVSLKRQQCLAHGDVCNVSQLVLGTHTGTHIDGLNHFIEGAAGIDQMPLDLMFGKVEVIEIRDENQITASELSEFNLQKGGRYFFKTINSPRYHGSGKFEKDFVHIAEDAALLLAEKKVALIGVDYLSVGGFEGNVVEVHRALLGNQIWCVEGLDLREVSAGPYEVVAMPIRLVDGDGGLARVMGRRIG